MENSIFKRRLIKKAILSGAFAVLSVAAIIGVTIANEVIRPNEGFITNALCSVRTDDETATVDGDKLAEQIEEEGIVLGLNKEVDGVPCLPLSKENKKVAVFGHSVVDWLISNSGSGSAGPGSAQKTVGLLEALEENGIEYNKDVIDFYKKWAAPRDLPFSISCGYDSLYRLADPSYKDTSGYKAVFDAASEDGAVDTAIVCLSRVGGEHIDVPHEQINNLNSRVKNTKERHYLQTTKEEDEMLEAACAQYKRVIVLLNTANNLQLDFLQNYENISACLVVGPTGTVGARAIPHVLWGDINPSGRTVDTMPYDHKTNVTYFTSGYQDKSGLGPNYTNIPSGANLKTSNGQGVNLPNLNFADYIEGIYVGYKWYETADATGFWDNDTYGGYDNVVAFPFGYGLSYTTFDWELVSTTLPKNGQLKAHETIDVTVKVTNTGAVAGRDVVECYLTAPYYDGEIEKASVNLVGFQKTPLIAPNGGTAEVTITLRTDDFASYDCYDMNGNGETGYELDAGTYELKLMKNAHEIKENVKGGNTITWKVNETITNITDSKTDAEVKNLFTGDEAIDWGIAADGSNSGQNIQYITRSDFAPLLTKVVANRKWDKRLETSKGAGAGAPNAYDRDQAKAWDEAEYDVFGNEVPTENPTWGANTGAKVLDSKGLLTDLGRELGEDYDSDEWDSVLDQCTWAESMKIINNSSSYNRPGVKSCGLRKGNDNDYKDAEGASQVGVDLDNKTRRLTAYPTPIVQAACWNTAMPYQFGLSEAKDMTTGGIDALYGPASNIHRTPFGGRNSEYHSEDGFLAGKTLAAVTRGLSDGGKQGYIKHFALNDTEFHRVGLYTWATEQAIREIYLRPFEEAVKWGEATAIMTSFNRIGACWTGGSQALIQGVCRNEWGFKGQIITDMIENSTMMDISQHFRAGANQVLGGSGYQTGSANADPKQNTSTPRLQWRMRENLHQVIYAQLRVLYLNEQYNANPNTKDMIYSGNTKSPWVWWKPALACAEGLVIGSCVFGLVAALVLSDQEFNAELIRRIKGKKNDNATEEGK